MDQMMMLLGQNTGGGGGAAGAIGALIFLVIYLGLIIFVIAGMWKMFVKAGQPGWGAIVPIYNTYLMCKIGGRPGWWLILLLIPIVNLVVMIILMLDIAKAFGKGAGFAIGLILLGFIFIPILGFGGAEYQGPPAR